MWAILIGIDGIMTLIYSHVYEYESTENDKSEEEA